MPGRPRIVIPGMPHCLIQGEKTELLIPNDTYITPGADDASGMERYKVIKMWAVPGMK